MADEKLNTPSVIVSDGLPTQTTYAWDSSNASTGVTVSTTNYTNETATMDTSSGIKAVRLNTAFNMATDHVSINITVGTQHTGARIILAASTLDKEASFSAEGIARYECDTGVIFDMDNYQANGEEAAVNESKTSTSPNADVNITIKPNVSGTATITFGVLDVSFAEISVNATTYPTLYLYFGRETGTSAVSATITGPVINTRDTGVQINYQSVYATTLHADTISTNRIKSYKVQAAQLNGGAIQLSPAHTGNIILSGETQVVSLPAYTNLNGTVLNFISPAGTTVTLDPGLGFTIISSFGVLRYLLSPSVDLYGGCTLVNVAGQWYVIGANGTWVSSATP